MSFKKERNILEKEIGVFEKELKSELRFAERWMVERRKFFIKLGWTVGVIALLLILSNIYLRVRGLGV
jgi:hypothetical protein